MSDLLYLDASALVKLVVREPETEAIRRVIVGRPTVTSEIAMVEVMRAASRREHAQTVMDRANAVLARVVLLRLNEETLQRAGMLRAPDLRSLGAVHLAAAKSLGGDLEAMVIYDRRLAAAASEHGIQVLTPGTE